MSALRTLARAFVGRQDSREALEQRQALGSETWRVVMDCAGCGARTDLALVVKLPPMVQRLFDRGAGFACHCPYCDAPIVGPFERLQ